MTPRYFAIDGGLPPQTELHTGRAVFTEAYAVIPKGVMRDIVTSSFPFWEKTRAWILARPLSGFAETFSQYVMEVAPSAPSTAGRAVRPAQRIAIFLEAPERQLPQPLAQPPGHQRLLLLRV